MKLFYKDHAGRAALWILLPVYAAFAVMDIMGVYTEAATALKYAGIWVCFLLAVFCWRKKGGARDAALVAAALTLTLAADTLLLLFGKFFWGVLVFCLVQAVYALRYRACFVFAAAGGLAAAFLAAFSLLPPLYALAGFYGALFAMNLFAVFRNRSGLLGEALFKARLGMVLFFLCDINVMLYNLLPATDGRLPGTLIWGFYLPAQYLLATSAQALQEAEKKA